MSLNNVITQYPYNLRPMAQYFYIIFIKYAIPQELRNIFSETFLIVLKEKMNKKTPLKSVCKCFFDNLKLEQIFCYSEELDIFFACPG